MNTPVPDRDPSPLVSIVMPCFNAERYLGQAMASVQAQGLEDWELLIVDNGSHDGSMALAEQAARADDRIRVMTCREPGAAHARNTAISAARGRYIAFLDSDDQWLEHKLARQLELMQARQAAMSWTAYRIVDSEGRPLRDQAISETVSYEDHMAKRSVIGCLTVMYDSAQLGKQLMPIIRMRQDYGLWARLIRLCESRDLPMVGLSEVLALYRVHDQAMTRNKLRAAYFQWRLYRDVEQHGLLRSLHYFWHYARNALVDRARPYPDRRLK